MLKKGFVNVLLTFLIVFLAGVTGYFLTKKPSFKNVPVVITENNEDTNRNVDAPLVGEIGVSDEQEMVKSRKTGPEMIALTVKDETLGICGFSLPGLTNNQLVNFPLTIKAVVDNSNAESLGCIWAVFEAQAGVVKVIDGLGQEVGMATFTTTEDWMTTGPVNYQAVLNLTKRIKTTNLSLVFYEDNTNDESLIDSLIVPVHLSNTSNLLIK